MRRGLILVLGGAVTACAILVACGEDELPIVEAEDASTDATTDATTSGDSGNELDTGSTPDTGSDTGSDLDAGQDSGEEDDDGGLDLGDGGEFDGSFEDAGPDDDDAGDAGVLPDGGPATCNLVAKPGEIRTTCTTRAVVYNGGVVRVGLYKLVDVDMQQATCTGVRAVSVASAIRVTAADGGQFRFERIFEVDGGTDQIRNYTVQRTDAGNTLSARRTCPAPLNPLARPETWSYNSTRRVFTDAGVEVDLVLQHPFPNVPGANAILRYRRER